MGSRSSDKVDEAKPDHAQTNEAYPSSVDNRGGKTSATTSFGLSSSEHDIKELLTFPNESTHAYSYNPLSPNSLAVRLRILKRSLEIMIRNPSLLQEHRTNRHLRVETPNGSQKEFKFGTDETISPKKQRQLSRSYSHDGLVPLSTSKLRNASSAALSALVTNTKGHSVADLSNSIQPLSRPVAPFQKLSYNVRPSTERSFSSYTRGTSRDELPGVQRRSVDASGMPLVDEDELVHESGPSSNNEALDAKKGELES